MDIQDSSTRFIKKYNVQKIKECNRMLEFCNTEIYYLKERLKEIEKIKKNCETEISELYTKIEY